MFSTYQQINLFLEGRKKLGVKPGLGRVYYLLERLGNPERKIKAIHVAGTNGKGSTVTSLKEMLYHNGYRVGTYTTPSISGLEGEIGINEERITEEQLVRLMNRLMPVITELDEMDNPPTEFEIKTAAAICFLAENADISVIETGMGGTKDATNCFIPLLSIITNVGLDHQRMLGESLSEIASHKAGIIKQGIPVVVGDVTEEAAIVILKKAESLAAPVYHYAEEFTVYAIDNSEPNHTGFTFKTDGLTLEAAISMAGSHQVKNAALAMMALNLLQDRFPTEWPKSLMGLKNAVIPGRFEKVHDHPTVILDAAHNPQGITAFLQTAEQLYPNRRKQLLFAAFQDKALQQMLPQLENKFDSVYFTSFHHERAASGPMLQTIYTGKNSRVENWEAVVRNHLESAGETVLFITGSLYFIELVRKFFVKS
ncbi:bifunctional folylpolyglutamate synthase/dihydrofolate synthase [Virgibacillus senegalensis]|uniref:bifunctional folylpolyglutamate synthase/dihydrofolate synthase n=1 Tax=Virgibacillus senegalensis TaxID=1499679 RepID=UPI00069CE3AE|nr:folylpolyglutamate synthase/dihydrofolate synthase family protein [Virgibacillus senegalensis]